MAVSFVVGGFLAYGTKLEDELNLGYFVPKMSIVCIQQTFGLTLFTCYNMLLTLVPLSIFLFIVQKIGLGYHDYLATELLLLLSSFYVAYTCSQVQYRKITLFVLAVFFCSIVNQPILPSTFVFELLEKYVIGMVIALIVSILIFPFFATLDIENRVNYCLLNLQKMQTLILEAFLCKDQMDAQILLARSFTIEEMIRERMSLIHVRQNEARFEPSRFLQKIFNQQRKHIIDLTLEEQEDLIVSLMFHISSLQLIVTRCKFDEYHNNMTHNLESSLLHLNSCQSIVISNIVSSSSISSKDEFLHQLCDLDQSLQSICLIYINTRFERVQSSSSFSSNIQSGDSFSHAFFLFQLNAIVRLLRKVTIDKHFKETKNKKKEKKTLKECLKPNWSRLFSAIKSMIIIGVGSIFVMVPRLAKTFNNGQWILIALCMTQGDTVSGAFINMKMRLMGTLLGCMWAYVTYIVAHNNYYKTIGMLIPWIFCFGYLRLKPNWGYSALIASFTPILITLGRIPYEKTEPADNYFLLRIEENLIGISIGIILTILIFPVFAVDQLKDNIQNILQICYKSVNTMHLVYDQLFHFEQSNQISINIIVEKREIKSFFNSYRFDFQQLIYNQKNLIKDASLEPKFWWLKNIFSKSCYNKLIQQEIDMFTMLHNIDTTLIFLNECSINNYNNHLILPNLHKELCDLTKELKDCLDLWSSYFILSQTKFHRLFHQGIYSCQKLVKDDLLKHKQCLIELRQIVHRLQDQHEETFKIILKNSFNQLEQSNNNDQTNLIFISLSAMYYSTTQIAQTALALSTTIHIIFELETTNHFQLT